MRSTSDPADDDAVPRRMDLVHVPVAVERVLVDPDAGLDAVGAFGGGRLWAVRDVVARDDLVRDRGVAAVTELLKKATGQGLVLG